MVPVPLHQKTTLAQPPNVDLVRQFASCLDVSQETFVRLKGNDHGRGQESEVRSQRPGVRSQRSGVGTYSVHRSQKSEIRNQNFFRLLLGQTMERSEAPN